MKIFFDWSVRLIMGIITIVLVSASIRYSAAWHVYIGMYKVWAWGLAGSFIVFSTLSFDIGYGLISEKNNNTHILGLPAWFFFLSWGLITLYSMSSTVAGQYNQLLVVEKERSKQKTIDKFNYRIIQEKIERLKNPEKLSKEEISQIIEGIDEQIAGIIPERDRVQEILSGITNKEDRFEWSRTSKDNQKRLDELNKQISSLQERKHSFLQSNINDDDEIREKEIESLEKEISIIVSRSPSIVEEEGAIDQGNIFQYFAKIFGLSPLLIQFILSIFPAIFIDLISPISSALFFYGVKGRDGSYEEGRASAFLEVEKEIDSRLSSPRV